jgi:2'-5' RNA ligase
MLWLDLIVSASIAARQIIAYRLASLNRRSCASNILNSRVQLTLFVAGTAAERIEEVRQSLDPVQLNLIAAHVTLCRENELEGLSVPTLKQRLSMPEARPLTLTFGAAESFGTHGILLACVSGEENFQALRRLVLGSAAVRRQSPHITLAHPRNPKVAANSLAAASSLASGMTIRFGFVCCIRQVGTSPWQVIERFDLPVAAHSDA